LLVVYGSRDDAVTIIALGIISQGPGMDRPVRRKSFQLFFPSLRVAFPSEAVRAVAAGTPALCGVLKPAIQAVSSSGKTQSNRVRGAPFVQAVEVEETEKHVEASVGTGQRSGRSQSIVERFVGHRLGIVRCLGCSRDEPAYGSLFAVLR